MREQDDVHDNVVALVSRNPHLQSLVIMPFFRKQLIQELTEFLAPNLQKLNVAVFILPCTAKHLLENLPEKIQQVNLGISAKYDKEDYDHSRNNVELRPHHSLEYLEINGHFEGYQEYVLLPFLASCNESLKELRMPNATCYLNENIRAALARLGLTFKALDFGELPEGYLSSDTAIAQVISQNPQLISIDLQDCHSTAHRTTAAILSNISNLKYLNVRSCTRLSGSRLNSIFCAAQNLKSVIFMDSTFSGGETVFLDAHLVAESEWACTSLERFEGMIAVPRPTVNELSDEDNGITLEESRRLQQGVYHQLARLTKLRYLCLGQVCWSKYAGGVDNVIQTECLEMSLESGMGELASIKDLRRLYVCNMDHGITRIDREWMYAHWPDLDLLTKTYPHEYNYSDEDNDDSDEQDYEEDYEKDNENYEYDRDTDD